MYDGSIAAASKGRNAAPMSANPQLPSSSIFIDPRLSTTAPLHSEVIASCGPETTDESILIGPFPNKSLPNCEPLCATSPSVPLPPSPPWAAPCATVENAIVAESAESLTKMLPPTPRPPLPPLALSRASLPASPPSPPDAPDSAMVAFRSDKLPAPSTKIAPPAAVPPLPPLPGPYDPPLPVFPSAPRPPSPAIAAEAVMLDRTIVNAPVE